MTDRGDGTSHEASYLAGDSPTVPGGPGAGWSDIYPAEGTDQTPPDAGSGVDPTRDARASTAAAVPPPAGWYPDPWTSGYHRYWNGAAWTSDAFPSALPGASTPGSGPTEPAGTQPWLAPREEVPPPPEWAPSDKNGQWGTPRSPAPPTWPVSVPADDHPPNPSRLGFIALLLAMMLVVGAVAVVGGYLWVGRRSTAKPAATGVVPELPLPTAPPNPTLPTTPAPPPDPSASALSGLVVTAADVAPTMLVQPLRNGDQVSGETTLDLCNGTFASESLRTARLQVQAFDELDNAFLSTEAVLYRSPDATAQAFAELKAVAAACPNTPVVSPVGGSTYATHMNPAPDAAWPQEANVERLAFDFVTSNDQGETHHSIAVYLRRGRVLMGIYFAQPDGPQKVVAGQDTVAGIANVFAGRIAQLPATVVSG